MAKNSEIIVKDVSIRTMKVNGTDYLCITDIAKQKNNAEPKDVVKNWMRQKNTLEYLGLWERLHNPTFKGVEFDPLLAEAGSNSFTMSPSRWVELTAAIGITTTTGRNGGTYAITDIAFKFANWVSVEFELYLVMEFQRLKAKEQELLGWTAKRELSKINYRIHTDAIKSNLIPAEVTKAQASIIYAEEADVLNVAMFGMTAKQWREANPELKGNIRDYATINELICLSNIENINAVLINDGFELPVRRQRTASTSGANCQYVGLVLRSFRYAACLILMMVLGIGEMWGQTTGLYFIANNNDKNPEYNSSTSSTNYYLVPASNGGDANIAINRWAWNDNAATPFVTTYKTNKDNNSIWIIKESDTSGQYYLIHVLSGKYMTRNDGVGKNSNRRVFHMENPSTLGNDHLFNFTTHSGTPNYYSIRPQSLSSGHCFLNPSKANKDFYCADPDNKEGEYYIGGLIGTYNKNAASDKGSKWFLETAPKFDEPTMTVNTGNSTFSITTDLLPPNCSIRYTTGNGTQAAPAPSTEEPSGYTGELYDPLNPPTITDFTNVKAVIVGYGMVLSNVADQMVKCATPSISYANNTVTIETSTPDATIYYTSTTNGTVPDDPTTSAYTGTGSSPLITDNVSVTTRFKAIAVKDGMANSSVASQTVVVNPTIELSSYSYVYTGSDIKPIVTINGGAIPSSEYEVTYSNNKNVGTATATITNNPGGDYYVVGGSINFEITKAPVTVTANNQTKEYGDSADPELTFTASGLLGSDTEANAFTGTLTREPGDAFGTYAISRGTLDSDNYTITSFTGATLTITAKAITITADSGEKVYDGTALTKNSYATNTALVSGDAITSIIITGSQTNAGSSDNVPSGAVIKNGETDVTANYNITYANGTLTVTPKPVTITANDAEKTYDGSALTESGFTASDLEAGDTHTFTVTMTAESTITNAGSQSNVIATVDGVTVTTGNETAVGNYLVITVDGTLTVNPKGVTLTANSDTREYNGEEQTVTGFTCSVEGLTFTGVSASGSGTAIGTYEVTFTGVTINTTKDDTGNYVVIGTTNGTLTIMGTNNIHITLTMNGWTYGDNPKNPSISIAEYDAKDATKTFYYKVQNAADATYKTDAPTKSTKAGTYTVKVVVEPHGDYNGGEATKDFTIAQAKLTITAQAKSKDYLDEDPVLTYTVSGLKNDEKQEDVLKVCNLQRESGEDVKDGGYAISINETNFTISSNYYRDFVSNVLTINPKNLGDGETSAPGIGVYAKKDGDAWDVSLYNGKNKFDSTNDYDPPVITGPDDGGNYTITITGKGSNCEGTAKATYSDVTTFYSIDGTTEKFMPYISTTSDLMTSADLVPYIVAQINPTIGTISIAPINYIPEGVPVLLLAPSDVTGITTSPKNPVTPAISESLINSNQLQMAPDEPSDPDDPESVHGVHVEDTEAYVFYQGEFVLTTEGTIKAGKYYLYNPNYRAAASPSTPANPAPMRSLSIVKGETTGIIQLINDETTERGNDVWYTIDGQRLTTKPTRKGFYIKNGKKIIVK